MQKIIILDQNLKISEKRDTVGGGITGHLLFTHACPVMAHCPVIFPIFFKTSKAVFFNRILCRFFSAFQKYKVYFSIPILSDVIALFQHVIAPFQRTVLDWEEDEYFFLKMKLVLKIERRKWIKNLKEWETNLSLSSHFKKFLSAVLNKILFLE